MVFDARGVKRRHEFLRGVMRSAARLTYAQAQAAFDGKPDQKTRAAPGSASCGRCGTRIARVSIARDQRSPLDLDLPERRIIIGEDGKIQSIAFRERLESMRLIEEFMIMANVAAAETLEQARMPLIYRVHEEPSKEKLLAFSDYLRTIGIPFAKGQVMKPAVFNRILERATRHAASRGDQRRRAAHAGASGLRAGQCRAFRLEPRALCAFHLADPALCRSRRASRADPRAAISATTA